MTEVEVRCDQCGETRCTYNDVRTRPEAMIECKAKCFETHNHWTFVREVSVAPAVSASDPAAASSASAAAAGSSPNNAASSSDSDSESEAKPKRAFDDQPEPASPDAKPEDEEEGKCCTVM